MAAARLPSELWSYICEFLDTPSLRSLSVVDHRSRSIAVSLIFRKISIQSHQASQLEQVLRHMTYNKHVRVLEVYDRLEPTLQQDDAFSNPGKVFAYFADYRSQDAHAHDSSWQPVAALLLSLPALTDLIWTSPQQFPPCLLWTLHNNERFATCRLHLRTFRLRSLATAETTVDPYELELVQSPNLYSIWFYHDGDDVLNNEKIPEAMFCAINGVAPNLRSVRLRQEIIQILPAFPSTLSHIQPPEKDLNVAIETCRSLSKEAEAAEGVLARLCLYANNGEVRRLSSVIPCHQRQRGRLEGLQFTGVGPAFGAEHVRSWSQCTDFSVLRALVLDAFIEGEALTNLAGYHFPSLTTLAMSLYVEPGMMSMPENRPHDLTSGPARDFLCSLPPLGKLRLRGEIGHAAVKDILAHHGQKLHTLQLMVGGYSPNRLSLLPTEVLWIGDYCRALRDLDLQMLRSRGNASEVAAFASLGSLAFLQTLDLKLDASDYTALRNEEGIEEPDPDPYPLAPILAPAREYFDGFDREFGGFGNIGTLLDPLKGHFKDMFINAALDRNLVQSIFAKLTEAKPPRSMPFDRVDIRSIGGGDFGMGATPAAIATVVTELQRRWLFQKDWNSDGRSGSFGLTELEYKDSEKSNETRLSLVGNDLSNENDMDSRVAPIFRRLWSAGSERGNWRNEWHSLPLG